MKNEKLIIPKQTYKTQIFNRLINTSITLIHGNQNPSQIQQPNNPPGILYV